MFTEDMAKRFGAKLREIEPLTSQRLPVAMSNLLRAIAQAEQPSPTVPDECSPGTGTEETAANNLCGSVGDAASAGLGTLAVCSRSILVARPTQRAKTSD